MHSLIEDALVFDMPVIEGSDETLLVHYSNAVDQVQQVPGGL